jgi:hypothetical protein
VVLALVIAGIMAFFPTDSYLRHSEASSWYIIQKQAAPVQGIPHEGRVPEPARERPETAPAKAHVRGEGC